MKPKKDFGQFIKLTNGLYLLTKFLSFVTIVAGVFGVLLISVLSFFSKNIASFIDLALQENDFSKWQFRDLNIPFDLGFVTGTNLVWFIVVMMSVAIVSLVIFYFMTRSLKVILKNVNEKNPFSHENVKHIQYLGYMIITSSFFSGLYSLVIWFFIKSVNFKLVDLGLLFVGLLILLLSSIFQYGNFLQEEFDTLI